MQQNPILRLVLNDMRSTTILQWRMARDTNARETAWMLYQTVDGFESALDGYITEILKAEAL